MDAEFCVMWQDQVVLLLLLPDPFRGMRAWKKTMEPQKPGNSPWPGPSTAPINSRFNVVVRSPTPFGLIQNGCWPSRGSQLPRALPFIFSPCCPLNDCRRAAHSFFKIGRLFSLFSCPSLNCLRLVILLLLLMSGNVDPNPGPIDTCSVCAGNVTWWGKSVQCCTCSK